MQGRPPPAVRELAGVAAGLAQVQANDQRRSTGRRVSVIGVLHGHARDSARLQIDRMPGFAGEMRAISRRVGEIVE
jgi:hypothetical protein